MPKTQQSTALGVRGHDLVSVHKNSTFTTIAHSFTCDIADFPAMFPDCNGNGVPDECEIADDPTKDCNDNGALDEFDIADGPSTDTNQNGIPNECEN